MKNSKIVSKWLLIMFALGLAVTGCALDEEDDDADEDLSGEESVNTVEQDVRYPQLCWDVSGWDLVPPCLEWTGGPPTGKIRLNFANGYESVKMQRCTSKRLVDCHWTTVAQTHNNAVKSGWVTITRKGPSWWRQCVQKYTGTRWKCAGAFYTKHFEGE